MEVVRGKWGLWTGSVEVWCSGGGLSGIVVLWRWAQWKCGVVEMGSVEVWFSGGGLSGSGVNVNECNKSGIMNVRLMEVASVEMCS